MKTYSLRKSTLISFFFPLLLTVVGVTVAALWASYEESSALNDAQMSQLANTLHVLTRHEALEGEDVDLTLGRKSDLAKPLDTSMVGYRIWGRNSLVTESPNATRLGPRTTRPGFSVVRYGGVSWRMYLLHDAANAIDIEIAQDHSVRWLFLRSIGTSLLFPLLCLIAALLIIVTLGIGRAFAPLAALSRAVDERDANNLAPVYVQRVPEEILPIYSALNNLFARVGYGLQREREFTDNVAHELRTPLAALKTRAQVMARSIGARSPLRESMDDLLAIVDRSVDLLDRMLMSARSHETLSTALSVNLSAIVAEQVAAFGDVARQKAQTLRSEIAADVVMAGDAAALMILVRNLLDNALRYTPNSGEVSVQLMRRDGKAVLRVSDSGPGIATADRGRAMERFTRLNSTEAGTGLGLSIVNWVCRTHGAHLSMTDNNPHGLITEVVFDASETAP